MASTGSGDRKPHVVGVPIPAEGHVTPMMHLCSYLAHQGHPVTLGLLQSDDLLAWGAYNKVKNKGTWPPSGLNISLEKINSNQAPTGYVPGQVPFNMSTTAYQEDVEELLKRTKASHGDCVLIMDYTVGSWCMDSAVKVGVPVVIFFPGSITWCWFELKMMEIVSSGLVPMQSRDQELTAEENSVVLNNPYMFQRSEIPWHFWNSKSWQEFTVERLSRRVLKKARWILVNSCCDLESEVLSCMVDELGDKFIPVGPLCLLSSRDVTFASSTGLQNSVNRDCLRWLDEQEAASVLYISFGSFASLSSKQREEFTIGLEQSQKKFLWVVRTSTEDGHEEFLKELSGRTKEQGIVVTWSPQVEVLSHKSVAAFISHCGWNSTIESIACGKPVLCLPLLFDQGINSRLIVERWNAGMKFSRNTDGFVDRVEVERVIRSMMETDHGRLIRETASQLGAQLQKSLGRLDHGIILT